MRPKNRMPQWKSWAMLSMAAAADLVQWIGFIFYFSLAFITVGGAEAGAEAGGHAGEAVLGGAGRAAGEVLGAIIGFFAGGAAGVATAPGFIGLGVLLQVFLPPITTLILFIWLKMSGVTFFKGKLQTKVVLPMVLIPLEMVPFIGMLVPAITVWTYMMIRVVRNEDKRHNRKAKQKMTTEANFNARQAALAAAYQEQR